jgi:branched-chain amino acid transport system permease protein
MTTALVIQLLLLGLLQGGIYALVACGLTLIYGVMKIVNFAHAEFLTLGMFLAISAFQIFGLSPYTAAPFIFAIVFILGAIAQQLVIRPALHYPQINQMLITIGLSILLVGMMQLIWGPNNQVVKLPWARATLDIAIGGEEISLNYVRLIAALVAVAVAGAAWWILKHTRTGNAMRAAAQNPLAARLMGINVSKINLLTFGFGTGLAALSGALISPAFFVNPTFGTDYFILPAFVIVVLGTMGNFVGALVGGLIIGLTEAIGGLLLGPAMRQFVSLTVFVVVLLFLPRGIFKGKMS